MPKIIEGPKYSKENTVECEVCLCKFQYFDNEVVHEYDNDIPFMSGTGYCKYIICPSCEYKHIFKCEFYEDITWIDKITTLLSKIRKKLSKTRSK